MGEGEDQRKANQIALRFLSYRARSTQEIRDRLREKGVASPEAEKTVAYLMSCGYINDRSLAQDLARSLFANKGWGFGRIAATLRSRGVPPDLVDETLSSLKQTHSEAEAASAIIKRRFLHFDCRTAPPKEKKRVADFLQRRGFSWDTISRIVLP